MSTPPNGLDPRRHWSSAIVDGHVHLHSQYDVGAFLNAAARNLMAHGLGRPASGPLQPDTDKRLGVLLLTDMPGQDGLRRFKDDPGADWRVTDTGEPESLLLTRRNADDDSPLLVVTGRQVVTAEKIEVLVLGTTAHPGDGRGIDDTIDQAVGAGGLPVLTWGFGKWLGPNASVIARLASDIERHPMLFFADSSVRLAHTPLPAGLKNAKASGRIVLAGTDPLPIAQEEGKAGRLAFMADCAIDSYQPWSQLRDWLASLDTSPEVVGRFENPVTFARNQFAMQMRKRLRTPSHPNS